MSPLQESSFPANKAEKSYLMLQVIIPTNDTKSPGAAPIPVHENVDTDAAESREGALNHSDIIMRTVDAKSHDATPIPVHEVMAIDDTETHGGKIEHSQVVKHTNATKFHEATPIAAHEVMDIDDEEPHEGTLDHPQILVDPGDDAVRSTELTSISVVESQEEKMKSPEASVDVDEANSQAFAKIAAMEKRYKDLIKGHEASKRKLKNKHKAHMKGHDASKRELEIQLATLQKERTAMKADLASRGINLIVPSAFMALPPEIRNMIYRFALVEPHKGYLKLHYDIYVNSESKLYVYKSLPLQLFQVCRQVNSEASSLFYGENVFAIAEQYKAQNRVGPDYHRNTRRVVDTSRIQKMHITNRNCRWLSDSSRSSPGVFREGSKHHISAFVGALKVKEHSLQYLLIDCLSGFHPTKQVVSNIFKPMYMMLGLACLTGLRKAHIVAEKDDHRLLLRYIEKCMIDRSMLPFGVGLSSWSIFKENYDHDIQDHEMAIAGNELAFFLKIKAPYSSTDDAAGK